MWLWQASIRKYSFKDAALDNWYNILNEANKRGQVDLIVQIASSEYPENEDLKNLYKEVNAEPLMQTASSYKLDNLKFLIAEGKTKETIKTLLDIGESISSDFYTSVIMQSARFKSLRK
ncbi:MAG: hypothetical protein IPO92_10375 [Saprospiraceae bacterium]|nr:hypothetical protein [Saprospiraceae bacterium]